MDRSAAKSVGLILNRFDQITKTIKTPGFLQILEIIRVLTQAVLGWTGRRIMAQTGPAHRKGLALSELLNRCPDADSAERWFAATFWPAGMR